MTSTAIRCPGCGQQVDPLGNDTTVRLSRVHPDLCVHHDPTTGTWHSCCARNPLKPMAPAYHGHVED
jgi:hypothetical protein